MGINTIFAREAGERVSGSRVLYVSSAIGLGHFSKDLAIANELRALRPDVDMVWLAGHPASDALADAGEAVLPEAEGWRSATVIAENTLRDGQIDLVHYAYRSLSAWAHNARLFKRVVQTHGFDLAVGDEAWEISLVLTTGLLRLKIPFVLVLDFIGLDVMKASLLERILAYPLNADATYYGWKNRNGPHSGIFIGELEDLADEPIGWGLPNKREHARKYYDVVGHVISFHPEEYRDRAAWRRRLGYDDRPLVICSVGGTTVGRELLELCGRAVEPLRKRLPDVHMVLVCGPRLPVESVQVPEGVEVRGYVPRLYEHHACADVAVGQCGASSTTELAALRTPFVYFPIEGHFEQEVVAARLARVGAGVRMTLSETTPEMLAERICAEYGREPTYPPLPVDGARRAAQHLVRMLETGEGQRTSHIATSGES